MPQIGGFMVSSERAMPWWRNALRWGMIALGLVIAAHLVHGISYTGPDSLGPHGLITLALVVFVLTVLNIVFKPLLVLFTCPFVLLTLGLGLLVINALLFWFTSWVVPGFHVLDFWAAFWGALIVSLMSMLANRWLGQRRFVARTRGLGGRVKNSPASRREDDVIDV